MKKNNLSNFIFFIIIILIIFYFQIVAFSKTRDNSKKELASTLIFDNLSSKQFIKRILNKNQIYVLIDSRENKLSNLYRIDKTTFQKELVYSLNYDSNGASIIDDISNDGKYILIHISNKEIEVINQEQKYLISKIPIKELIKDQNEFGDYSYESRFITYNSNLAIMLTSIYEETPPGAIVDFSIYDLTGKPLFMYKEIKSELNANLHSIELILDGKYYLINNTYLISQKGKIIASSNNKKVKSHVNPKSRVIVRTFVNDYDLNDWTIDFWDIVEQKHNQIKTNRGPFYTSKGKISDDSRLFVFVDYLGIGFIYDKTVINFSDFLKDEFEILDFCISNTKVYAVIKRNQQYLIYTFDQFGQIVKTGIIDCQQAPYPKIIGNRFFMIMKNSTYSLIDFEKL